MKKGTCAILMLLVLALLAGCAPSAEQPVETDLAAAYVDVVELAEVEIDEEAVALAGAPAVHNLLLPEASGTAVKTSSKATIDYSNVQDGYVMVKFTASTTRRLKARVTGPNTQYTYNLTQGEWTTFPLADGNGSYKVTVYEQNPSTGKYATVTSVSFNVTLTDEFAPFLRPNQYVDYADATDTIAKAEALTKGVTDPLEKVEKIYDFVVHHLSYDTKKAKTVQSGYLPDLDDTLATGKGICFDYAALMTAMLRSQGVPCKLVTGYAGDAYHAWVSVWTEESGWVEGAIYFDGTTWHRMDPTFASSGNSSKAIMQYIGDGSNYSVKYLY